MQANVPRPTLIQIPGAVPIALGSGRRPRGTGPERGSARTWPVSAGEQRGDRGQRFGVLAQSHARGAGQGVARQVVLRRSQAAGRQHQVGPLGGGAEDRRRCRRGRRRWWCGRPSRIPSAPSSRLSHWLLVSSLCPLTSSLPIEMISALSAMNDLQVKRSRPPRTSGDASLSNNLVASAVVSERRLGFQAAGGGRLPEKRRCREGRAFGYDETRPRLRLMNDAVFVLLATTA